MRCEIVRETRRHQKVGVSSAGRNGRRRGFPMLRPRQVVIPSKAFGSIGKILLFLSAKRGEVRKVFHKAKRISPPPRNGSPPYFALVGHTDAPQ